MKPRGLQERILASLHATGPATVGQLASSLSEPLGIVLFALERLRDKDKHIRVLAGGLWDVTDEYPKTSRVGVLAVVVLITLLLRMKKKAPR